MFSLLYAYNGMDVIFFGMEIDGNDFQRKIIILLSKEEP